MNTQGEVLSKIILDESLEPKISLFNFSNYKHGDIFLDHTHEGQIEIMYVYDGYMYMHIDGGYIKVQGNECLIVFPGNVHSLIPKKHEKCNAACIVFDPGDIAGLFNQEDINGSFRFLDEVLKDSLSYFKIMGNHLIRDTIEAMRLNRQRVGEITQLLYRLYFCELYLYLSEELNQNYRGQGIHNQHVHKAIGFIINNSAMGISVKDIADHVKISERHLVRLFNSELGMSVHEYIMLTRIEKAKKVLYGTDQDITTIGVDLGFSSSQHFATVFKNSEGISPSAFRKSKKGISGLRKGA